MEALRDWQQQRRSQTLEAVVQAVETLQKEGEAVNFRSVSALSGLTRKTLYKVPEAKALILSRRASSGEQESGNTLLVNQAKRIAELENELHRLKSTLFSLRIKIPF